MYPSLFRSTGWETTERRIRVRVLCDGGVERTWSGCFPATIENMVDPVGLATFDRPCKTYFPSFPHPASTQRRAECPHTHAKLTQGAGPPSPVIRCGSHTGRESVHIYGAQRRRTEYKCQIVGVAGKLSPFLTVLVLLWERSALLLSDLVPSFLFHELPPFLIQTGVIPRHSRHFPAFPLTSTASLGLRRCCSSAMFQPPAANPVQGSDSLGRSEAICGPLNVRQTNGYSAGCSSGGGGCCCRGGSVYPAHRPLPRFFPSVYDGVLPKGEQMMWRQRAV